MLELGAGLGLNAVGLAARGAAVVATEVEPALSAFRRSMARNRACWAKDGGSAAVEVSSSSAPDLLYSRELRAPLLRMLHRVVARAPLSLEARGDELNFLSQAVSQLGMAEEAEEEEVEEEEAGRAVGGLRRGMAQGLPRRGGGGVLRRRDARCVGGPLGARARGSGVC